MSGPFRRGSIGKRVPWTPEKFWKYVNKTDGCWIWTGPKFPNGYGASRMSNSGPKMNAHRIAWILTNGPIQDGLHVCHNCPGGDNPICVRPDHMFLGTCKDNLADCSAKGRMHPGSQHGMSKLTEEKVIQIRALSASGVQQKVIASMFGMSKGVVCSICNRKAWKHV